MVVELKQAGIRSAVVNAGGDLRVIGSRAERVHLRGADAWIDGAVMLADAAIATSGNAHLRRRAIHHLARRRPVAVSQSVSVVAPLCVLADAMTKVALADPALAAAKLDEIRGAIVTLPDVRRAAWRCTSRPRS